MLPDVVAGGFGSLSGPQMNSLSVNGILTVLVYRVNSSIRQVLFVAAADFGGWKKIPGGGLN